MIVIPMAGMSSRFTKAGYDKPKYMLEAHEKTLFYFSLLSFKQYFQSETFLFIYRDVQNTKKFILDECEKLGIPKKSIQLCELSKPTSGQAETVAIGLRSKRKFKELPILIFNIDTFRPGYEFPTTFDLEGIDGYLEVFEAQGDHWSFAKPDENSNVLNKVEEVAEKVRISNLCSTGIYYFKSANLFLEYYAQIENRPLEELQGNERYIAPIYNDLISDDCDIRYEKVFPKNVVSMGTPQEYTDFLSLNIDRVIMRSPPKKKGFIRRVNKLNRAYLNDTINLLKHLPNFSLEDVKKKNILLLVENAIRQKLFPPNQTNILAHTLRLKYWPEELVGIINLFKERIDFLSQDDRQAAVFNLTFSDILEDFDYDKWINVYLNFPDQMNMQDFWLFFESKRKSSFSDIFAKIFVLRFEDNIDSSLKFHSQSLWYIDVAFSPETNRDESVLDTVKHILKNKIYYQQDWSPEEVKFALPLCAKYGLDFFKKANVNKKRHVHYEESKGLKDIIVNKKESKSFTKDKPRIALCLSGQMRSFEEVSATYDEFFKGAEVDIYIHTWKVRGTKFPVLNSADRIFSGDFLKTYKKTLKQHSYETLQKQFTNLVTLNFDSKSFISEECLHEAYGARLKKCVVEDDSEERFQTMGNQYKMLYKIKSCYDLIDPDKYDLIFRARPDRVLLLDDSLSWKKIAQHCFEKKALYSFRSLMIRKEIDSTTFFSGDQFAVSTDDVMKKYSNLLDISLDWKNKKLDIPGWEFGKSGHVYFSYFLWINGIESVSFELKDYSDLLCYMPTDDEIIELINKDMKAGANKELAADFLSELNK